MVLHICEDFRVIPWFQIPSECLLLVSPFVSLAQISPSGCSRSPVDLSCSNRAPLLPSLPHHCPASPQLRRCHPCSPRKLGTHHGITPSHTPSSQSPGPVCSLRRYFSNPSTSLLAPLSLFCAEQSANVVLPGHSPDLDPLMVPH